MSESNEEYFGNLFEQTEEAEEEWGPFQWQPYQPPLVVLGNANSIPAGRESQLTAANHDWRRGSVLPFSSQDFDAFEQTFGSNDGTSGQTQPVDPIFAEFDPLYESEAFHLQNPPTFSPFYEQIESLYQTGRPPDYVEYDRNERSLSGRRLSGSCLYGHFPSSTGYEYFDSDLESIFRSSSPYLIEGPPTPIGNALFSASPTISATPLQLSPRSPGTLIGPPKVTGAITKQSAPQYSISTQKENLRLDPDQDEISLLQTRHYRDIKKLGAGYSGGYILQATSPSGELCAIKSMEDNDATRMEAQVLSALNHPNVVRMLDCFNMNGRLYIVMEYLIGEVTLRIYLDPRGSEGKWLDEFTGLLFIKHLISGVQHIHNQGYAHMDLHQNNVALHCQDGRLICKIVDFGQAVPIASSPAATAFDFKFLKKQIEAILAQSLINRQTEKKIRDVLREVDVTNGVDMNAVAEQLIALMPEGEDPPKGSAAERYCKEFV